MRRTLEYLEDRTVPAVLTVTKNADDGTANTLRWAIQNAAANDHIVFAIGAPTAVTIGLNQALGDLPAITASGLLIDGFSQGGGVIPTPFIDIDGGNTHTDGLTVLAAGVTIQGLAISDFTGDDIILNNPAGMPGDLVIGCNLGTDITGSVGQGNAIAGIVVQGANNTIGSSQPQAGVNIISGNGQFGVVLGGTGAVHNLVEGNLIGVDGTGKTALANRRSGILLDTDSAQNTIGGAAAGAANVISGNRLDGIAVNASSDNLILGNFIGVGSDGSTPVANGLDGIGFTNAAVNNTIGAPGQTWSNIISGNGQNGINLGSAQVCSTTIVNNVIGLDSTANNKVGNGADGVYAAGAGCTQVGGSNQGQGNVISGNGQNGVHLASGANGSVVAGNKIGTNGAGTPPQMGNPLGNGQDGVLIQSNDNTVGGTGATGRNVISGNSNDGVRISGGSNNLLVNNYIGTDIFGKVAIANAVDGVRIEEAPGAGTAADDNTIGGTQTGSTNVISGNGTLGTANTGFGISLSGNAVRTLIQGNYIGVAVDGTALGNQNSGIDTEAGADNTTIGGAVAGAGNVISANGRNATPVQAGYGVDLGSANDVVQNNIIGLKPNGTVDILFANKGSWKNDTGIGNQWLNNQHN